MNNRRPSNIQLSGSRASVSGLPAGIQKVRAQELLEIPDTPRFQFEDDDTESDDAGDDDQITMRKMRQAQRQQLKKEAKEQAIKDPAVIRRLEKFWSTAGGNHAEWKRLPRPDFMAIYCLICKALRKDFSLRDAILASEHEWQREMNEKNEELKAQFRLLTRDASSLDVGIGKSIGVEKETFFKFIMLFPFCWLECLSVSDYIDFLDTLFHRITHVHTYPPDHPSYQKDDDQNSTRTWRPLASIQPALRARRKKPFGYLLLKEGDLVDDLKDTLAHYVIHTLKLNQRPPSPNKSENKLKVAWNKIDTFL
jgi:hypothetical protein